MPTTRSTAVSLFLRLSIAAAFLSLLALHAQAAINQQIPFYGTLTDTAGTELSGTYDMVFRFYDAPTGGTLLDTSTHTAANGNAVTVNNGEFNVMLGSGAGNTLDGLDFNTDTIYIGLSIEGDSEMTPRERLGAAPYAFNSDTLDGYDATQLLRYNATGSVTANSADTLLTFTQQGSGDLLNLYDGATEVLTVLDGGNVGIGTSTPGSALSIVGDLQLSGALIDSNYSGGTNGYVLQSTGAGTQWVATSSLGITGGGSSLFTDGGATTYLTATSDQLALGTTSAPAGTKLYVEGGGIKVSGIGSLIATTATSTIYPGGEHSEARGNYLYTIDNFGFNFLVHDISDPQNPEIIGQLSTGSVEPTSFVIVGDYAYLVSDNDSQLLTIDISDPTNPTLVNSTGTSDSAYMYDIVVLGKYLYGVSSGWFYNDIYVFDITDPENPIEVSTVDVTGDVTVGAVLDGEYLYTANDNTVDNISVYDLSNRTAPTFIASTTIQAGSDALHTDLEVKGDVLYVAGYTSDGISVVNISDPANPLEVAFLQDAIYLDLIENIKVINDDLYVTQTEGGCCGRLVRIDVSSTTNPRIVEHLQFDDFSVHALSIQGNYAYITTSEVLAVVGLNGLTAPSAEIGSILANLLEADTAIINRLLTVDGQLNVTNDALFSGSLTVLGSASNPAMFVDGEIVFSSTTPATTTNALYNLGGSLFFNGSEVGAGVSLWTATGSDLYYASGTVGIGTSTPSRALTVDGAAWLTGALYDNSNSAGLSGYVLQSSGSGFQWVATSTLGGGGASSSPFTTSGSVSYLTSTTSSLVLGTTTSPTDTQLHVANGGVTLTPGAASLAANWDPNDINILDAASDVVVSGAMAYVTGSSSDNLALIDIDDSANPALIGNWDPNDLNVMDSAQSVAVTGKYAYVTGGQSDNLVIIDISNPSSPATTANWDPNDTAVFDGPGGVVVSGRYAYIAGGAADTLAIVDVADPTNPTLVGLWDPNDANVMLSAVDVIVAERYAYVVGNASDNVAIVDISDPSNPTTTANWDPNDANVMDGASDIAISGNRIYVTGDTSDNVAIVNVADPNNPTLVGNWDPNDANVMDNAQDIVISGDYAYVTGYVSNTVVTLNIADPTNLYRTGVWDANDVNIMNNPTGMAIDGNVAFVAGDTSDNLAVLILHGLKSSTGEIGSLRADTITTNELDVRSSLRVEGSFNVAYDALIYGNLAAYGGVTLSSSSPATTTNTLYNVGGQLYFDGVQVATFTPLWNSINDDIYFDTGNVAIGTTTASSRLTVADTSGSQLTLSYNGSNSTDFLTNASGDLTITPSGGDVGINGALTITGELMVGGSGSNDINGYYWGQPLTFSTANATGTYAEVMRVTEDYRVGIGTTTPTQLLTVDGDMYLTGSLYDNLNSSGSLGDILTRTANGVEWSVAGGGNNWATLGTNVYFNTGNVGIGTSSPTSALTIAGSEDTALLSFADTTNVRQLNFFTGTSSPEGRVSAPVGSLYIDSLAGTMYQKTGDNGGPNLWTVFDDMPTTTSATSAAAAKIEATVAQTMDFNTFEQVQYDTVLFDNASMADTANNRIVIPHDGTYVIMAMVSINNFDDSDVAWMRIEVNGSPAQYGTRTGGITNFNLLADLTAVLELNAGDVVTYVVNNFEGANQSTNVSGGSRPYLAAYEIGKVMGSSLFTDAGTTTYLTSLNDNLAIGTSSSAYKTSIWGDLFIGTSTVPDLLVETGTGKVGIGTSTLAASSTLTIEGGINASNLLGGAVNLTTDANGNIIRDPSDVRLKENITDIDNALDIVNNLRGVRYEWVDKERFGSSTEIGFIAQEVDLILPEVVRKGGDYWSLNTRNILAVVVEAVKELWLLVSGNEQYISELENRVEVLEAKLGKASSTATTTNDTTQQGSIAQPTGSTSSTTEQPATTTASSTAETGTTTSVSSTGQIATSSDEAPDDNASTTPVSSTESSFVEGGSEPTPTSSDSTITGPDSTDDHETSRSNQDSSTSEIQQEPLSDTGVDSNTASSTTS